MLGACSKTTQLVFQILQDPDVLTARMRSIDLLSRAACWLALRHFVSGGKPRSQTRRNWLDKRVAHFSVPPPREAALSLFLGPFWNLTQRVVLNLTFGVTGTKLPLPLTSKKFSVRSLCCFLWCPSSPPPGLCPSLSSLLPL